MAVFLQYRDDAVRWGVWKMDETIDELLNLLPRKEWYREHIASRFRTTHRQMEWLAVRVLLYQMLGEEKEITYAPTGKPYLADGSSHISISHTKGYVAVILDSAGGVGIDIEQYGNRIHKVAYKFMRDDEAPLAWQGDDTWGLLLHWSAKEVMFKCMDADGVDFRDHLYIEPFMLSPAEANEEYPQGMFRAFEYKTERQRRFLIHYLIHTGFVLTWCVENEQICARIYQ